MLEFIKATTLSLDNFDEPAKEASAEGYRFVDRLLEEWRDGTNRFDRDGEVLLLAFENDVLAGIGGITWEPGNPDLLRMRRFFICSKFRRKSVATLLVSEILLGLESDDRNIVVNAGTSVAPLFWEAIGFEAVTNQPYSHILSR